MRLFHLLVALGLMLAWTVDTPAAKAKKKKGVRGVVTSVERDKDQAKAGTITLKVQPGKKAAANPGAAEEKKFKVGEGTKFAHVSKVAGQKGQFDVKPAAFADVAKGYLVEVVAGAGDNNPVEKVSIVKTKVKKKKKAK
jgi:hypothetical protein